MSIHKTFMKNNVHIMVRITFLLTLLMVAIPHMNLKAQPPRGPFVISPKVNTDNTVTFSYLAPNAKEV